MVSTSRFIYGPMSKLNTFRGQFRNGLRLLLLIGALFDIKKTSRSRLVFEILDATNAMLPTLHLSRLLAGSFQSLHESHRFDGPALLAR
jgi:hypothetical protein